jgi:hypothetical protein
MSSRSLVRGINATSRRREHSLWHVGQVQSIQTSTTPTSLTILFSGGSVPISGVNYQSVYSPAVGDWVVALHTGPPGKPGGADWLVLGTVGRSATINGGPPTSTPSKGTTIQDTKYGVTWWYDGSAWHANGPGHIVAKMSLNANTAVTASSPVPWTTIDYDPSSCCTTGATARFTCPIAGRYRITVNLAATAATAYTALIRVNGNEVQDGIYNAPGTLLYTSVTTTFALSAAAYLQGGPGWAGITVVGADYLSNMTVEFVSS